MKIREPAQFRLELVQFSLCFACEDCAHFDPRARQCGHRYPVDGHTRAAFEPEAAGRGTFCKEFELA